MMLGLGADWQLNSEGQAVDCSSWFNLLDSTCWGFGGSAVDPTGVTKASTVGSTIGVSAIGLGLGAAAVIATLFLLKR